MSCNQENSSHARGNIFKGFSGNTLGYGVSYSKNLSKFISGTFLQSAQRLDSAHKLLTKRSFLRKVVFRVKFKLFLEGCKGFICHKNFFKAQKWLGKFGIRTHDPTFTKIYFIKMGFSNPLWCLRRKTPWSSLAPRGILGLLVPWEIGLLIAKLRARP